MANFIDRGFIWSSLLLVCLAAVTVLGQDWYGPRFVRQPPLSVTFGNNTGTVLTCQVTGQPVPQVSWRDRYGAPLPDVLDLRSTLDNGSLWFHPFPASNYRQDVHTASVQCHVTNVHGTVVSRQVKVNAVVSQPYDVTLNDVTAGRGSTAVVWCRVSSYANGYVKVTSWRFGDLHLAVGHRSDKLATWRDLMLIRDVTEQDENVAIRCETMDTLSDTARLSSTAYLHLHDIGRSTTSAGGLFHSLPVDVEAHAGQDVALYCPVLDTPAASVSWYHQVRDLMTPLYHSGHVAVGRDLIRLRRVRADDSGIYRCSHLPPISNDAALGVSSHDFRLQVTSPVRVEILPARSLVHVNQATRLTCHVQPESLQTDIIWLRNGQRISAADGLTSLTLPVNDPTVAGMYQCHVTEDVATAEVRLAVWPPRMSTTLVDHTVQPGSVVSLTCSASGPPRPDLGWYSNGQVIPASRTGHRRRVKTTVSESGDVTSQLTISPVSVRDAGSYRCLARNQAGEVYDTAQLHVYGSAAALPRRSLTLAAGSSVVLDCPVSGYPLSEFAWRLDGVDLSRQLLANGSLRVEELQTGEYSCRATGGDGTRITGFIHVNVLDPPEISPFSFPHALRAGQRTQAACSIISGHLPIAIVWLKDNASVAASAVDAVRGAFFSNLVFNNLQERHAGVYTCRASNSVAVTQFSAQLEILVPPRWLHNLSDITASLGDDVVFNCSVFGKPRPTLQWTRLNAQDKSHSTVLTSDGGRTMLVDPSGDLLTLRQVTGSDAGRYTCSADNGVGTVIRQSAVLNINAPARFDQHRRNVSAPVGGAVRLSCAPSGDPPLQLTWSRDNRPISAQLGDSRLLLLDNLTRAHTGHYSCTATNTHGHDRATWVLTVTERPEAPLDVRVTSVTSRSVLITWSPPYDGNSPLTHYVIQYTTAVVPSSGSSETTGSKTEHQDAFPNWKLVRNESVSSHQRSSLVSGLQPSTLHWLRVLAVNGHGPGAASRSVHALTSAEPPAGPPLNVRLQTIAPSKITVSWTPPPASLTHGQIVGYNVNYRSTFSQAKTRLVRRPDPSVTLRDLRPGTRYSVYVEAFNSAGTGPPSATVVTATMEDAPSGAPSNVSCTPTSSSTALVVWSSALDAAHVRGALIGYQLLWRKSVLGEGDKVSMRRVKNSRARLSGLQAYTNYTVAVSALTAAGRGPHSVPVTCTTAEQVCDAPRRLKLVPLSAHNVSLVWLAPLQRKCAVFKYRLYQRQRTTLKQEVTDVYPTVPLAVTREHLTWGSQYDWWVTTVSVDSGESRASSVVTGGSRKRAGSRMLSFSGEVWPAVDSSITLDCANTQKQTPVWTSDQTNNNNGLTVLNNGSLFFPRVTSAHAGKWRCTLDSGDSITVELHVQTRPVVTSPEVVMATNSKLHIRWKLLQRGNSPIQKYHVRYITAVGGTWKEVTTLQINTELVLSDLFCGTEYTVTVTAENQLGRGEESQPLHSSTKGLKPSTPSAERLLTSNSSCITLRLYDWSSDCDITDFSVSLRPVAGAASSWRAATTLTGDVDLAELCALRPGTWYLVNARARSQAGSTRLQYQMATLTALGERLTTAPLSEKSHTWQTPLYGRPYVLVPVCASVLCIICAVVCLLKNRNRLSCGSGDGGDTTRLDGTLSGCSRHTGLASESRLISEPSYNLKDMDCGRWDDVTPYATVDLRRINSRDSPSKQLNDSCGAGRYRQDCHYTSINALNSTTTTSNSGVEYSELSRSRTLQSGVSLQPYLQTDDGEFGMVDELGLPPASGVPPPPRCNPPTRLHLQPNQWRHREGAAVRPPQAFLY